MLSKDEQSQLLEALSYLPDGIQRAIFQATILQAEPHRQKKIPILKLVSKSVGK